MAHWTALAFLVPVLLVAVFCPLQADTEMQSSYTQASCFRKETYNTTSKVKVQIPVNKTRYDWCLGGFMRCMVYKVEMAEKEINVTEIRSRFVEMCCPGMIPAPGTSAQSTNETLQCIPAPGTVSPPVTTASTTTFVTTPREVCKTGLWGRGCSHTCTCGGAPCNQDTGACLPCSPNDTSCASSSTSTTVTTTSTTTPVPTTPSTTPSTTSFKPPTTSTTTATTTNTSTTTQSPTPLTSSSTTRISMISTLATTKTSIQRTVENTLRVRPSNASEIPVAVTTESSRTVSTTGQTARLTEFTTVRPVVATREQGPVERRKDAPGKSMAQPAKTTAQPIDPEAVNRVDISPGNGKPKPDTIQTNTSSTTALNPAITTFQRPTTSSTHPTYPITHSISSVSPSTIPKPSTVTTTTTTPKPTLATQVSTTSTTPKPLPKQSTPKQNDSSSEESDSEDSDDDDDEDDGDDDDDDEEEEVKDNKDFKKMTQETILTPPGKPPTRIDKIQTKINGSQHLMTWTFQTDFSVGPPIKLATPFPRKNAISPGTENRNASVPALDKNTDDKNGVTTVTYGVKPWMPALNLATEAPIVNEQTLLDNERSSFDKPTTVTTSTPRPTTSTTVSTMSTTQTSTLNSTTTGNEVANSSSETSKFSTATERATSTSTLSTVTKPVEKANTQIHHTRGFEQVDTSTSAQTTSQLTSIVTGTFNTVRNTNVSTDVTISTQHIPHETSTKLTSTPNTTITSHSTSITTPFPTSTTTSTQTPTSQTPSMTVKTSTTLKVPSVTIPAEPPPVSVQTLLSSTVQTTTSTLRLTPLQGHIGEPTASVDPDLTVQHSVTSPRSVHNINQLGLPPRADHPDQPTSPSAAGSGAAGAAVAAVAITLAVFAILCVLVIFVQTRNQRSKRRPGVAPPPSPPLISAWHSVPHYSETFATAAATRSAATPPLFSDQFEQPAVEHVYQEITPLANVTATPIQPADLSPPQQDTGPTKVLVKLRNVETYVVR